MSNVSTENWRLSQDCCIADDRVDQPFEEQEDSVHHRPEQGGPPLRVEVKQAQGHQGAHRHAGRKNKLYFTHKLFFMYRKSTLSSTIFLRLSVVNGFWLHW